MTKNKAITPSWRIHLIRKTRRASHAMAKRSMATGWSDIHEAAESGNTDSVIMIRQGPLQFLFSLK